MTGTRVILSLEDFKKLVAGQIVTKKSGMIDVKIILSDIGFDQMFGAIADAVESIIGDASLTEEVQQRDNDHKEAEKDCDLKQFFPECTPWPD